MTDSPSTASPAAGQAKMPDPVELSRAVANIAERSQRLVADFAAKQHAGNGAASTGLGTADPLNIAGAFMEMTAKLMVDPTKLVKAQVSLWNDYMRLWQRTAERFLGGAESAPVIETPKGDKRFKDPAWEENTLFDFIKQSYLLSARFMQQTVKDVEGLDDKTAKKVEFYTRQFVDALAPSNFVMTNPEVLRTTIDTRGENLIKVWRHNFAYLPPFPAGMPKLQQTVAKANEYGLYVLLLVLPITGLGRVLFRGQPFDLLFWHVPALFAENDSIRHLLVEAHEIGAEALLALIGLHAGAALFHRLVLRDGVLQRMLPRISERTKLTPTLAKGDVE